MPVPRLIPRSAATWETDIVWGAWSELGVSGWSRSHRDWAVDPEPLIIATPLAAARDVRLREETLDWCVSNWRRISRVRLRNLLRFEAEEVVEAYAAFAATVNHYGGASWPTTAEPQRFATTGRSSPPRLSRQSMVWLRMRAMFGVGARTEILRYFLSHEGRVSVTQLASAVGYTKRNVADECLALQQAGVLAVTQVRNRLYYSLARAEELRDFVGDLPAVLPDWTAMLRITRCLVGLDRDTSRLSARALNVEASRVLRDLEDDFDRVDLLPPAIAGNDHWLAARQVIDGTLSAWAQGRWPA